MRVHPVTTAAAVLAAVLSACLPARATTATYTWTGDNGASNSWYSAGNWSAAVAPLDEPPSDYVFAASGWNATQTTIAIDGTSRNPDAAALTFNGNPPLNGNASVPLTIQIGSGNSLWLSPSSTGATTISVAAQTGVTDNISGTDSSATIQLSDDQAWSVAGDLGISAVIWDDGELPAPGFVKTGGGTLTLSGTNSFSGPISVAEGTLSVATITGVGQSCNLGRGGLTLAGGTLSYTGPSVSTTRGFALGTGGGTINVQNAAASLTFTGAVTGGQVGLTKTGSGVLTLAGPDTYTGNTMVGAGTLGLSQADLYDASNVSVASGAVLNLAFSSTDIIQSLYLNGVEQAPGLYNASDSGGYITGSGSLLVTVGVPEPSTLAVLAAGLVGLAAYAWRKRTQQKDVFFSIRGWRM